MATAEADPIARFRALFAEACAVDPVLLPDPTAMTLATADATGHPSARVVLLKHVDERGFVFYTNYRSRKGRELLANPHAALCFWWPPLETQVRVEGHTETVSVEEADAYFASRARESQIGAWASQQSETLASAEALARAVAEAERRFERSPVPRPPHWSGFRIVPGRIEFWRARAFRLHERELYERDGEGWRVRRLFP